MIGKTVYYKVPGMPRTRKGVVIGGDVTGWQVQARRSSSQTIGHGDTFIVPAEYLKSEAEHKAAQQPSGIHEVTSTHGRQITATELNRRATVAAERFQMTEAQILQARAMLEIRKRIIAKAAHRGRITATQSNFDFQELLSEYTLAAITAFRTATSKATVSDIQSFRDYIEEKTTTAGYIALSIFRSGKTAAIRYLKARSEYHHHHEDISDHAWRLAA